MRGINPAYLDKLDPAQREFILTATGKKFWDEFICKKGNHAFVVGNTGSGKTQKGYWLVNWLMHTETIIWISTGKNNEILPLLSMGKPVRIICPKGCTVQITERDETGKWKTIENHPEIVPISEASSAWWAIKKGSINVFEFRNCFWEKRAAAEWMSELFSTLATWTRLSMMPAIFPFSLFGDESQWFIAGTRVTTESVRVKTAEVVTENALEIRSAGGRLVLFAQDYTNITPASRENLINAILCRGAHVDRSENSALAAHCSTKNGRPPANYHPKEGKFVHADGTAYPATQPWVFPQFPKSEDERKRIAGMRIKYDGFFDRRGKEDEIEAELMPNLGRYAALAIPPEHRDQIMNTITRYDVLAAVDEEMT
jgi:hypothetical protein